MDPLNHLCRGQAGIPMTYTGDLQVFRNVVSAEMLPSWTAGDREAETSRAVAGADNSLEQRGLFSGLET